MPTELINLSLPAHLRYDPDNMIVWLLIPSSMSAQSQLKYFEYLARAELNPLFDDGVPGPDGPVKIKLFGASLDLKGKEKFYNQVWLFSFTIFHSLFSYTQQEAVTGYCGCSTCLVQFDQGPGGPIRAVSRRMLPLEHPLRQQRSTFRGQRFFFRNTETRGEPKLKTTQTLLKLDDLRRRHGVTHYMGQKTPPILMLMKGLKYLKFNLIEWIHNLGRVWDCVHNLLIIGRYCTLTIVSLLTC